MGDDTRYEPKVLVISGDGSVDEIFQRDILPDGPLKTVKTVWWNGKQYRMYRSYGNQYTTIVLLEGIYD